MSYEPPHMPTHNEILVRATEMFMEANPGATTPEEYELKEGSYWQRARLDIMSGVRSALEGYLSQIESEADRVREELGIEKPLPTSERLIELENQLARVDESYKTTKKRLKEATEELRKILEKPPPPPPRVKSYSELQREFEGKEAVDALAAFTSGYKGLKREYRLEDLNRFLRELRAKLTFEDLQRFYKVYPGITNDFVVFVASSIGWIPQPPLVTGLADEDKRRLEDLFKRVFIEAGASYVGRLPVFRDELRRLQEDLKDIPRARAVSLAEKEVTEMARRVIPYKPPAPIPVPVPVAAVPVRVVIVEDRVRKLQERTCIACRGAFVIDLDLKKRVTEETTEIRGRGRVHREPAILEFPERFYHMCPNCRWTRFGYSGIYDALAYLLAEGRRSSYKKVKLTKDKLRAVGLNKMDLDEIQTIEARYRVSSR